MLNARSDREILAASAALDREKAHRELDRLLHRHTLLLLELETMRRVQEIDRKAVFAEAEGFWGGRTDGAKEGEIRAWAHW